jgi:hypothetical protein
MRAIFDGSPGIRPIAIQPDPAYSVAGQRRIISYRLTAPPYVFANASRAILAISSAPSATVRALAK